MRRLHPQFDQPADGFGAAGRRLMLSRGDPPLCAAGVQKGLHGKGLHSKKTPFVTVGHGAQTRTMRICLQELPFVSRLSGRRSPACAGSWRRFPRRYVVARWTRPIGSLRPHRRCKGRTGRGAGCHRSNGCRPPGPAWQWWRPRGACAAPRGMGARATRVSRCYPGCYPKSGSAAR
jgi:hypothetical protein